MIKFTLQRDLYEKVGLNRCTDCPQAERRKAGKGYYLVYGLNRAQAEALYDHLMDVAESTDRLPKQSKLPRRSQHAANRLRTMIDEYLSKRSLSV